MTFLWLAPGITLTCGSQAFIAMLLLDLFLFLFGTSKVYPRKGSLCVAHASTVFYVGIAKQSRWSVTHTPEETQYIFRAKRTCAYLRMSLGALRGGSWKTRPLPSRKSPPPWLFKG